MRAPWPLPIAAAALALAALLAAPHPAAREAAGPEGPRDLALAYLAARTADDPAFPPPELAPYLVEAAAAAGLDPALWPAPDGALARLAFPPPGGPLLGLLRPAHAWAASGRPLEEAGGRDVAAEILGHFDGTQFGDPSLLNDDTFAILALRAAGRPATDSALAASASWLAAQQVDGWPWQAGGTPETDVTGMVLAALDGGPALPDTGAAAAFLESTRAGDGWALRPGGAPNCESTAWGLRAVALLGRDPPAGAWGFLLSLQAPSGGFAHRPGLPEDARCTAEATTLLGLAAGGKVPFASPPSPGREAPMPPLAAAAGLLLATLATGCRGPKSL